MKKIIFVLLGITLFSSFVQARFYLGIEGGYSVQNQFEAPNIFNVPDISTITHSFKNGARGYNLAFVLGTENFYGKYVGTRFGLNVGYTALNQDVSNVFGEIDSIKEKFSYVDAGLELDLIINLYNSGNYSFGIFGGVDARYHYRLENLANNEESLESIIGTILGDSKHLLDFSGRAGITMCFANHHRIDFIARLPIASTNALLIGGAILPARTSFSASYKFVF